MLPVYLPYTRIHPVTAWSLRRHQIIEVEMTSHSSYWDYFAERWAEGRSFINHEHDVVAFPGAIELLALCPAPWCLYRYDVDEDITGEAITPVGLAKFSDAFIAQFPQLWNGIADFTMEVTENRRHWLCVDRHLHAEARSHNVFPHIHWPPVLHLHDYST